MPKRTPSRLQQRVVAEFAGWAAARGAGPQRAARVAVLLRDRPDPTRWRSGDVHALFMDDVVPRRAGDGDLAEHGLDTFREFLLFLDDTDRLHPASARPAALLKELDRLTAKYPAAMAVAAQWEPEPAEAVGAEGTGTVQDEAALAKAVATDGAALLRDLATLAEWVGPDGRPVDDRGEVRKKDLPTLLDALHLPAGSEALTALWQQAVEFDVVRLRRGTVVRGSGADLVGDVLAGTVPAREALELWTGLADLLIHPVTPLHAQKGAGHLRDWLDPWTPLFLELLATTGGPADLAALTARLLTEQVDRLPDRNPELFAGAAGTAIRNILTDLARHGAVTMSGAATAGGAAAEQGVTVELTDLGRHLARRR